MTDKIWIEIKKGTRAELGEHWSQAMEWNGTAWAKASGYCYKYSGGKNGKWTQGAGGAPVYTVDASDDYTFLIYRTPASIILRDVFVCSPDSGPPVNPPRDQHNASGFKTFERVGNGEGDWFVQDSDPNDETLHLWIWARHDAESPVIRCDPMVHNRGGRQ